MPLRIVKQLGKTAMCRSDHRRAIDIVESTTRLY